ncbi:MAG: 50S ribosomal protein L11 methyltransferase [Nitrospira sp.]|nr:MAG: 50S ribosomal protein L11 methyltransferase [Nitrospira sp.]
MRAGVVMQDEWIDVTVRSDVDAAELLGLLADPFVQGSWQDDGAIHIYWPSQHWSQDRYVRLRQVLQQMEGRGDQGLNILVQSLSHQDWNRQWAESVKPLRVGHRIVIRPSWEPVDLRPGDVEIILDPKQAFGTGHHATTRMLLEWLEDRIQGGESVLDVGAGSGILAMASLRLGATSALGVECDPVAVDCARDYGAENGFGSNLEFRCGTLEEVHGERALRPDLVLANLDRQTLLQLRDKLAQYVSRGARLLLSGILIEQEKEVVEAFSSHGALLLQRREQEGWVALELLMAESCEGVN